MSGRNVFDDVRVNVDQWFQRSRGDASLRDVIGRLSEPPKPCVFISYRSVDRDTAGDAAKFLQSQGVHVYFDQNDDCLKRARQSGSDAGIATCLEIALDRCNALLNILTDDTFTSPWPPYEIGSARGRAKFQRDLGQHAASLNWLPTLSNSLPRSHAVAHLITAAVQRVPEFVKLGVPITDVPKLRQWADVLLKESGSQSPVFAALSPLSVKGIPPQRDLSQLRYV